MISITATHKTATCVAVFLPGWPGVIKLVYVITWYTEQKLRSESHFFILKGMEREREQTDLSTQLKQHFLSSLFIYLSPEHLSECSRLVEEMWLPINRFTKLLVRHTLSWSVSHSMNIHRTVVEQKFVWRNTRASL